ncbi:cytochrome P450 [Aspergillus bertholletiae]|uniref:Cytochrome P450 n=1 Tax=Aspergillus bertholletiae TaxID=1226010 RepID=A0A5N7AS10_9EURO|nr:cytochrome P450 [Aspergillus bertholletiae]
MFLSQDLLSACFEAVAHISKLHVALVWLAYLLLLAIYRLYLSPLAAFPGPRLAALTMWYQAYYDLCLRGQYFRRIEQLHKQYGPVVRINPYEIHVNDPDYLSEVYGDVTKKRDKYKWLGQSTSLSQSTGGTIHHDLHRKRRAAINPFLSKAKSAQLEPVIRTALARLLQRFENCRQTGTIMPLNLAMAAATCDIITQYCFGQSTDFLLQEDYSKAYFDAVDMQFNLSHWMLHFSWLGPLLYSAPVNMLSWLMPGLGSLFQMRQRWEQQVEQIMRQGDHSIRTENNTIFHGILMSDLAAEDKTLSRLAEEAQLLVIAGHHTAAHTISAITFQLLSNPDKLLKLKKELATSLSSTGDLPRYAEVEHLPYLTAVIKEGLRLHPTVSTRIQRVSAEGPLFYHDRHRNITYTIPAGTPVSVTQLLIHMNPDIFPSPREFQPERWLGNPHLDRYFVAFSKGSRTCAGINVAYQEMSLIIASLFQKFDIDSRTDGTRPTLSLYQTLRERDVDQVADLTVASVAADSKGVRLQVK